MNTKKDLDNTFSLIPCKIFSNPIDMGRHIIFEFCETDINLNDHEMLDKKLKEILIELGFSIEKEIHKIFQHQGLSFLYLFSDAGHFSFHSSPEARSCAIDIFCKISEKNMERS